MDTRDKVNAIQEFWEDIGGVNEAEDTSELETRIEEDMNNEISISQLDISVTRNERVDRRGRKRAVDVMLYDSSSNIELDQGDIQQKRRMTQLRDIMLVVIQQ
ncbi:hypothetical protein Pmani_037722 [Petrolisthes manimaculis]|uniref:Uncharacterized protein n=1 Tax=Petrolisthes manimaculis TaxID=1843537 RepID=A0AAE1NH47_9EUCA|nr:hypothetical protein Pmani_037722 [Petrolisthes manimaculis]